jgi:hypothetical protein
MANLASLTIATEEESTSKSKHDPNSVDEYLGSLPEDKRTSLQELRQLIRQRCPKSKNESLTGPLSSLR